MTDTQVSTTVVLDRGAYARRLPLIAAAVFGAAAAFTIWGAHDLRETAVVLAALSITMVGVYGFLLPHKLRQPDAGPTALTLSLIGLAVLLPAFWSGLPLVLGVAGALLGSAGRHADKGRRLSMAAIAIGALASIGYVAIYAFDYFAVPGIG